MKIRKSIVALLPALALLFPSCKETEIDYVKPEKHGNVYATVPAPVNYDPETKGISIDADNHAVFKWIKDVDNINVFSSKKGESMIYSIKEVSSEDPTHCSFLVEDFALKTGNTYYGFYPSANSNDPSKVIIDYSTQRQYSLDDDSHLSAYSYMVTAPVEASESGTGFAFSHKSGWLTFKILAKDDFIAEKIVVSTNTADAFIVKGTMDVVSQNITITKSASQVVLYLGEPEEGIEIKGGVPTRAFMALNDVKPLNNVKAVLSGHDMNGNAVEIVKEIVGERFYENGSASSITLQQEGAVAKQAKIGDTYYETLAEAVTAAEAGNTVEILVADTYKIPNLPKNITIKGDVAGVVFDCVGSGSIASVPNGATFENAAFNFGTSDYHGFQHAGTINMNGCTLNGKFFSYGDMNFDGCTFNQESTDYNMWCYGKDLTYTDCVFNSKGKFLNVYNEGNGDWNVTFDGCTFNSDKKNKAAVNIKETSEKKGVVTILGWNVVIKDCRVNDESMFPEASTEDSGSALFVGSPLWQVDDRNAESIAARKVTVTVDDIQVYPAPLVSVAKVGDTEYTTLEDAIKAALAANDGVAVELLSDITYAEGAAWTPIVFNGGTVVIDGKGYTVKGLPGMLFNKQGSGGHHLRMSNITFDGAKVNDETGNAAVIVGYADSMNELYFENVTVRNSTVIGSNYAAAFVGYAAGYSGNDGPVFQQVVFKNCTAENNTISGGGSTGALMGHASGNKWASITVEGATVENNAVTCTGTSTNKAGSVFGTVGAAGAELGPNGESAGLFVSATVSGNTVTSGGTNITTICGRQGSTGGRLVMTEGGSYDARPYNESDAAWASCVAGYGLSENAGIWTVVKKSGVAKIGDVEYETLAEAAAAVTASSNTVKLLADCQNTSMVTFKNDVTIEGNGKTITGSPIAFEGESTTIKNVVFNNGTSGTESAAYFTAGNVKIITIDGCTFNDAKWDALQITSNTLQNVSITNCVFSNQSTGHRYIHIQPSVVLPNVMLTITGNTFNNITKDYVDDSAVTIYRLMLGNMTIENNTTTGAGAGVLTTDEFWINNGADASDLMSQAAVCKAFGGDVPADLTISSAAELVAFEEAVNGGNTMAGKLVQLAADIDLQGVDWKPIGNVTSYPGVTFAGTFDGCNHTISNMTTSDYLPNHATAGFFGSIMGTVKNLTLESVAISSTHYAGAIAGYTSANNDCVIENCHVIGGAITSTIELVDGSYDNGDKVGGIIGYIVGGVTVKGCSVNGVTITAYRDLGGIVGSADNATALVTDNTVENSVIIQDNTNGYKTSVSTYGAIIGRTGGAAIDSSNTETNVEVKSVN